MVSDTEREKTDRRHIAGFKKFQKAAIRALGAALEPFNNKAEDTEEATVPVVKLSEMKSLVSAYKDAVIGERMVLGIGGAHQGGKLRDEPEELCLRWVVDETAGPGGKGADVE